MKPRWESGDKWRFRITEDITVALRTGWCGYHEFYEGDACWAVLRDDLLTVKKGYAFDGCSPCWRVLGRWVGTPTPPSAVIPAMVHDVLGQFGELPCAPWDKRGADSIFFNLMKEAGFPLKGTYHGAVVIFGGLYRRFKLLSKNVSCYEHPSEH